MPSVVKKAVGMAKGRVEMMNIGFGVFDLAASADLEDSGVEMPSSRCFCSMNKRSCFVSLTSSVEALGPWNRRTTERTGRCTYLLARLGFLCGC